MACAREAAEASAERQRDRGMTVAYVNGQVIDGRGKAYTGYVIVEQDKIAEVGEGAPPALGKSVVRKDLTSKSILPGLIDCHVHLRSDGLADPRAQQAGDTDAVALLRSARNARRTLGMRRHHDTGLRLSRRDRLRAADSVTAGPLPDAPPGAQRPDRLHDRGTWLAARS